MLIKMNGKIMNMIFMLSILNYMINKYTINLKMCIIINKDKLRELKQLLLDTYKKKFDYNYDYIDIKDFLYHYLRKFSMIITYLNKRQVFHDLIERLEFIIIDQ